MIEVYKPPQHGGGCYECEPENLDAKDIAEFKIGTFRIRLCRDHRRLLEGALAHLREREAATSCTNNSPPWFAGRWRDWHRGHGCDKDDGKPRTAEGAAEIAAGPPSNFLSQEDVKAALAKGAEERQAAERIELGRSRARRRR